MKKFLFFILISVFSLWAGNQRIPPKTANAFRIHSRPPKIDGSLNDAAWREAPAEDGFVQLNPIEKAKPSERTVFKILYDAKNIYFGLTAYDHIPGKITMRLSRRDNVDKSDFLAVAIDSYLDRRTAFIFGLNAAGVKFDQIISADGDNKDESWDPVWEGKTSINDSGWVAEMRIPFSQLRFAEQKEQVWGFQVYRKIFRKQEEDLWQFIPKNAPGLVSYFGNLKGIYNVRPAHHVEIMPYSVVSNHRYRAEEGNPFSDGNDFKFNFGLDGKVGITSDLTMDFTVNPDFGQVEADPSEVNLSAFETFFEEKRPFFIEGKNIFRFPLALGDGGMSMETLFYSRRIGRSPHYCPNGADGYFYDYMDQPENTRILGAAKLSGKTKRGWSVGILDAVTNNEKATIQYNRKQSKVTVEPLTNYFVGRLQKDYNEGNTSFGGMFTATNRRIDQKQLGFLNKAAYTAGVDIRRQWDNKTYFLDLKLAGSYLNGAPEAIELVQRSSARYFQRPDAKHVHLDTTRTFLSGHGGSFNIGRVGNSPWRIAGGFLWRSPGFETNDLGYLRQADQIMDFFRVGYRINNPVGIFRRVNINSNVWQGWNFGGDRLFAGENINGGVQFLNYWGFYLGVNRQNNGLSPSLLRGGPMAGTLGSWNNWFSFYSDERRPWRIHLNGNFHLNDDGISRGYNISFSFSYQINNQINIRFSPFFNDRIENLQYVSTLQMRDETRYLFGEIKQKTFGLVFRLNYSLTPNLSIQYYGQPFIAAGNYNRFKRITNPRAYGKARYALFFDRQISYVDSTETYLVDENTDGQTDYSFGKPDFNFRQFQSNLVIRWEYLPGSTLFLVWSQGRSSYESVGRFVMRDDMEKLYHTIPDNVFLVKMNYWFSF